MSSRQSCNLPERARRFDTSPVLPAKRRRAAAFVGLASSDAFSFQDSWPLSTTPTVSTAFELPHSLLLADKDGAKPEWTFNMLLKHGVRACLEYAKSFDLKRARSLSNPDLAPHLEFVDMGGHGCAKVRLSADAMRTEFVCIPRPIARSERPDGGPIRYRVVHTAALWKIVRTLLQRRGRK